MIDFIKKLFGVTPAQPVVAEPAPYKVETPAPAKCGCGRSQTGLCVGLHKLTPEEWATNDANPNKSAPVPVPAATVEAKVEAKAPAKKQQFEKKPAAMKATKKPAAKKPAAKKPATPKKV